MAIHNSVVLARHVPAPPDKCFDAFAHGTRVSVGTLFGSMPVRVKHRASRFASRPALDREWGRLVGELVALLLAWPGRVSLSLQEAGSRHEVRLRSTAGADLVPRVSRLFAQASLADAADASSWVSVSATSRRVRIKGAISTVPVATRHSQAMSLGIKPLMNTHDANSLYDAVNNVFGNSSFGVVEDAAGARPRKGLERWPMFYLQIHLLGAHDMDVGDVMAGSRNALGDMTALLQTVSYEFLKKHRFRPLALGTRSDKAALSTAKIPKPLSTRSASGAADPGRARPVSPFGDWRRGKVGWASHATDAKPGTGGQDLEQRQRLVGEGGRLVRRPFDHEPGDAPEAAHKEGVSAERPPKRARTLPGEPKPPPSAWLQEVLDRWENPVFETVQRPVPQLGGGEAAPWAAPDGRLTRAALADAEVMAQVDAKFILVKLRLEAAAAAGARPSLALAVVDQHAADERCRLEELMARFFAPGSGEPVVEALARPIVFEARGHEAELVGGLGSHFAAWGVRLAVERAAGGGAARVRITGLPAAIAERCRGEPRLAIELVRREAWAREDGAGVGVGAGVDGAGFSGAGFHGCPAGIVALLCSRACRGAVMFNDALTLDECRALVRRLARCAFPFQCAHGRPSMVPLADVGAGAGGWRGGAPVGAARWRAWAA